MSGGVILLHSNRSISWFTDLRDVIIVGQMNCREHIFFCFVRLSLATSHSYQSIWLYHCFHYLVAVWISALLSWVLCCCELQITVCLHLLLNWSSIHMKHCTIITKGKPRGDYWCILKVSKQLRDLLESTIRLILYFSVCNTNFWWDCFGYLIKFKRSKQIIHTIVSNF